MTSLGPSGLHRVQAPVPVDPKQAPESVSLAVKLWYGIVALECLHQVMNVVIGWIDPSELLERSQDSTFQLPGGEPTSQQMHFAVYFSLITSAALAMCIMAIVLVGANRVLKRQKYAENMRRMLLFFGVYLAFRGITPFLMVVSPAVPVGVALFDGALQILVAVGAALAAILGSRAETRAWTQEASAGTKPQNQGH